MGIEFGDLVRDQLTGFQGIAVSYHEFATGCARIGVQSKAGDKDGNPKKVEAFDIITLEVVEKGAFKFPKQPDSRIPVGGATAERQPPGGPRDDVSDGRETIER